MNDVWSVALKTPAIGRWLSSALQCRSGSFTPSYSRLISSGSKSPSSCRLGRHRLRTPLLPDLHQHAFKRSFSAFPRCAAKKGTKRASTEKTPKSPPKSIPKVVNDESLAQDVPAKADSRTEKAQILLSESQVKDILGPGLTFDQGMEVLQELQYRRVTGVLADKGVTFEDKDYVTGDHAMRALNWLREHHPVDEEAAAAEYAEEESERLRQELEARARRLGIYKREEGEEVEEEVEEEEIEEVDTSYEKIPVRPDNTADITGESALLARKEYVEKAKAVEKLKAEKEYEKAAAEAEARGEKPPEPYKGHALVVAKKTALEEIRKEKHERWERLKEEAELKQGDLLANRTAFNRLWKPVLFGAVVIGLSWTYAASYEPPKSSMRIFPSISPATATIVTMAALNLAVLIFWRVPSGWKFMNRYFLLSPGHPNAFSVLGSLFSHQSFTHLSWNMGMLYLVGIHVHEEVGRGAFLALYLTSGTLGYLTSLTFNVFSKFFLSATLGSSAAIFGLVGAYFTLTETRKIGILGYGETEFRGWIPLASILVFEVVRWRRGFGVIEGAGGASDHLTHIGGLVAGAVVGWWLRRGLAMEEVGDDDDESA